MPGTCGGLAVTRLPDMPDEIVAFPAHAGWPCGQWTAERLTARDAMPYVAKRALIAERLRAEKLDAALRRAEARAAYLSLMLRSRTISIDTLSPYSTTVAPLRASVTLAAGPERLNHE